MSFVDPDTPATLNATVDDVALIPATVPLSRNVEAPSVVAVTQRVANPVVPPVTVEAVRPSDDVATQRVDVPVVWSIIPSVPVADRASRNSPKSVRLVVVARPSLPFEAKKFVLDAVVEKIDVTVALASTVLPVTVSAVAEALVTRAFVAKRLVAVSAVADAVVNVD